VGAQPTLVYVGLGANLGDRHAALSEALAAIGALPQTELQQVSARYLSQALDAEGPDFINAVARVRTRLAPLALLEALQGIEQAQGRERPYPNAPRTLDLDLLLHEAGALASARLTLPHPRLHRRAFVLAPLADIDPDLMIDGLGPVRALLRDCAAQRCERLGAADARP